MPCPADAAMQLTTTRQRDVNKRKEDFSVRLQPVLADYATGCQGRESLSFTCVKQAVKGERV
jgi:hypothetical protein